MSKPKKELTEDAIGLRKFYKPYLSDEEDDSSVESSDYSESESDSSSVLAPLPQAKSAVRQNLFSSGGAPISSGGDVKPPVGGGLNDPIKFRQTTTGFTSGKNSTTIMINSRDRDTLVYPQPTFFSLRLPRAYRNVVGVNVTQIKLLSSFYYFAAAKNNTSIRIQESGRTRKINGNDVSNAITVYIRDGTYDANSLVTELNNQLNRTPIYNRISRSDFTSGFITTGNYAPLFNDPGDTTYNPVTGIFETLASKNDLINRYFKTGTNLGLQYYNANETLVAYFYPMLKDLTIGQVPVTTRVPESPFSKRCTSNVSNGQKVYDSLNYYLDDPNAQNYLVGTNYYDRIVYGFQGLDDPYITLVLSDENNQRILQQYKDDNTWDGYLVNRYICSYDSTVGRLTIFSKQLNTSLATTLDAQYQTILIKELVKQGISTDQVAGLQGLAENLNGVLIDMYNFVQTSFTNFFGTKFGEFAPIFYTTLSNEMILYDASGRYGWNLSYTGIPQAINSAVNYPDASGYWSRLTLDVNKRVLMKPTPDSKYKEIYYDTFNTGNYYRYTYTYDAPSDISGHLYLEGANEETLGYSDISFNVFPTAYSKVYFKTRCRQQLFIMTIPPYKNELPPTGTLSEQYMLDVSRTPMLFSKPTGSDCLLDPQAADFILFDISQNMLDGPEYMRARGPRAQKFLDFIREERPVPSTNTPPAGYIGLYTFRPHVFFKIIHSGYPVPYNYDKTVTKFKSDIYIEREDSKPFGTPLEFYWYRSRAAYMADVSYNLSNVAYQNPKHYFIKTLISPDVSSAVITTDFLSYQESYGMVITRNSLFSNQSLRIFAIRHDPYGIYDYPSVNDYRLMPVDYDKLRTKTNPITNFPAPYATLFNSRGFRNSYDLSGISNNLLDNCVLTTDFSHFDPYNFVTNTSINSTPLRYSFQFKTKAIGPPTGTSQWSQYFFSGSENSILDTSGGLVYYNSTKAATEIANGVLPYRGISNEFVFTNWFRAGSVNNLYNPTLVPMQEQTIAPYPVNDDPFTVFAPMQYSPLFAKTSILSKVSPFVLCKNRALLATDISYNDLSGHLVEDSQLYLGPTYNPTTTSVDVSGIMGIPFIPMMGRYVIPTKVVIKFSYLQPSYNLDLSVVDRNSKQFFTTGAQYRYISIATGAEVSKSISTDLSHFDDTFYQNRRNIILGVFRIRDILNMNISSLKPSDALNILSLKKISQVGQYSSSTDATVQYTRIRTPEWGTYYVYEQDTRGSKNLWTSWGNELYSADGERITSADLTEDSYMMARWATIRKDADISGTIFMKKHNPGTDLKSYYSDISSNGLCFIPFYPVLTEEEQSLSQDRSESTPAFEKPYDDPNSWTVGSFSGITYTPRPYLPVNVSQTLGENPWVFYDGPENNDSEQKLSSVCIEEIGNTGVSMGDNSTYLGPPGPFCLGYDNTGNIMIPNYRPGKNFTPTFFNIRINLRIPDTIYNPLSDFTAFGGYKDVSNCLVDTQTYFYDTTLRPLSDINDISGAWGMEKSKRFYRYDDDSGYNNLSYMPSIDLSKNSVLCVNVRGYVPTVKFLSGIRIVGKNYIDYGKISFTQLINEIADISANGISILPDGRLANDTIRKTKFYTYDYARALVLFNKNFTGEFTFGRGIINPSYGGITIKLSGFADFINRYIYYNKSITDTVKGITIAQTAALNAVRNFIRANYGGILPEVVLQRNRYTDPLTYSIQFKSALIEPYVSAYDQWGLGWNLGFDKIDTIFNTRHVAVTFIRIVDDYIYLKLNEELNINNIDISEKEDLAANRETFGQSRKYYGKLLLNAFGSFAQTFIQSAKAFTMPVGRLDKLTFQLVDAYNQQLSNNDCEYNVVLQIDELTDTVDTNSIIVKGT